MNLFGPEALVLRTGLAALALATVFVAGKRIHPLRSLVPDHRSIVSFSAGMSVAYVFVRMMPELADAREALVESAADTLPLPYEGGGIYFLALLGFLCFYALDRLRSRRHPGGGAEGPGRHPLHLAGLAAYVGLMGYLLVRSAGDSLATTIGYTLAFGGHFLALAHSLEHEDAAAWERRGRWLLAASAIFGWAVGVLITLPAYALALLVAFISGGVIMTNALMELSEGRDGRAWPFVAGSLAYGLILLPLG